LRRKRLHVGIGCVHFYIRTGDLLVGGRLATKRLPRRRMSRRDHERETRGQKVRLTWKTNFKPDFSKNHVHVFWNIYTADQVSNDAKARGVVQGEWVPTDDYPAYVTGGAVSTAKRGKSTTLCVTAGDRLHNVIDSSIVDCRDVTKQL
jgi:hypothetical protein